jgi:hypothetical protein
LAASQEGLSSMKLVITKTSSGAGKIFEQMELLCYLSFPQQLL